MSRHDNPGMMILVICLGLCVFSALLLAGLRIAGVIDLHWAIIAMPIWIPVILILMVASVDT